MKIKINVGLYSKEVTVVTSYEEFKKIYRDAEEGCQFITIETGNDMYILVSDLWGDMKCGKFMQCLSHELNHAAMSILGSVGVRFDYDNQEALCYLQDFLMRKCIDAMNKRSNK